MSSLSLKSYLSQRIKLSSLHLFRQIFLMADKGVEKGKSAIGLFGAENLASCPWPDTEEGRYVRQFFVPLISKGVSAYIENVKTDLRVLVWDELILPVTINEAEYENAYVCSPFSYFVSYAKESLEFLKGKKVYAAFHALLTGMGKILQRYQVNKVVVVNNWLCSTNLYPSLDERQVNEITQFLLNQFPEHAIVFRSIDSDTNPGCFKILPRWGFNYIASRQIFYINPRQSTLFESRLFKSDLKLLTQSGYEVVDGDQIAVQDLPRICALYYGLYIEKYSALNPKFNADFLELVLSKKLMHFKVLKKDGRIDGVAGFFQRNGMMVCPFFGYDRTLPKELALYRILSTVLMLEAHQRQLLFHQSAGASMYKKIRKSHACIEYLAVYYSHLNFKRKLPWRLLKKIYNTLGLMYMTRY